MNGAAAMSESRLTGARRWAVGVATLLLALPVPLLAQEPGAAPAAVPLIKLVGGLLGIVAVLLLLSRLLPRMGGLARGLGIAGHAQFKVLAALSVGQRERIVLMQAGERQLIVGVAPGRVSTLHVLEQPLELDGRVAGEPGTRSQHWLGRVLGNGRP